MPKEKNTNVNHSYQGKGVVKEEGRLIKYNTYLLNNSIVLYHSCCMAVRSARRGKIFQ